MVLSIAAVSGRLHVAEALAGGGLLVGRQGRDGTGENNESLENLEHFGGDDEE